MSNLMDKLILADLFAFAGGFVFGYLLARACRWLCRVLE